jgi:transposase InsO family protein
MPFKGVDVMDVKKEFVLKSLDERVMFTELCREYGISTKTGYKWRKRFIEEGYAGLEEQSRRPLSNSRSLAEAVSVELLRIKKLHPQWGAKKILEIYRRNNTGKRTPVRSTVENLFVRAGYTGIKRRRKFGSGGIIQQRITAEKPNDVWTVDFKGWWYTKNKKEKVNPLTVRDEYSRYILSIKVTEKGNIMSVKEEFIRLFKKFGLPSYIRSDNGPPFGNLRNLWGLTKLSVWWMTLGIKIDRSDPGHPEQNGAHERMHRDMSTELEGQIDGTLNEHQNVFDKWREDFNKVRPHEALEMKVPADIYRKSENKYHGEHIELRYGRGFKVRYVNDRGFINFKQKRVFIGNPFNGYHIGIKESIDKPPEIWFSEMRLGTINPDNGLVDPDFGNIKSLVCT